MSKMSELSTMIDSLIECGQKLIDVGNGLKEFYSETATKETKPVEQPSAVEKISFEDVRKILASKSSEDDGKYKSQIKELVAKYSSTGTLKGVPEDSYAALIAEAEVIGNG